MLAVDDISPGRPHDDVVDVGARAIDVQVMVDYERRRQATQHFGGGALALLARLEPVDPLHQAIGLGQRLPQLPAKPLSLNSR